MHTVVFAHTASYFAPVLGLLGLTIVFHYFNKGKAKQEKGFKILGFFTARLLAEENVKDSTLKATSSDKDPGGASGPTLIVFSLQ